MKTSVLDYLQLRVLSFYHEATQLKRGEMPAPRMCILYPTYVCNHGCAGCDYAQLNRGGRVLGRAEFDHVLDQLRLVGVKSVEFCGGGEPTLHPYLPGAMDRMIRDGTAFGLLTNGTNLTEEICDRLVAHGSYCRISVEAGSRETFDRYKKPRNGQAGFDRVIGNIRTIVEKRNARLPDTRLQISYKYSIDRNNYGDVARAVALARRLGVDSIQFKCVRNVDSEITDPRIIRALTAKLERLGRRNSGFRIMANLEKSRLRGGCWLSPLQVTVDPCGDVYICCYYRHRMEKHRLGNLLRQDLKDIWYSQAHWEKVRQIDPQECNRYDCRFHVYNELMRELVIEDTGQLTFI